MAGLHVVIEEQQEAVKTALSGHNFMFIGSAGTGKSYIINDIYEQLKVQGNNCNRVYTFWRSCSDNTSLGGLRRRKVIVSGDFFQLAPVPNKDYKDEGAMCFTSQLFEKVVPHKVVLTQVVRQDSECFVKAIYEVSKGAVSPGTVLFVKNLERPLPVGPESTSIMLFSNNDLVNVYNRRKILKGPGKIREFIAEDSGDIRLLIKSTAPPRLWLKEGCPVILNSNLSNSLVNGLRGKVIDFEESCPVVHFPSISCTTKLEKVSFTVFNPDKNMIVAILDKTSISFDRSVPQPSTSAASVNMQAQPSTSCAMEDSDKDDLCKVCLKGEIGTDWICCTNCEGWLHRACAKIKSDSVWKKISRPNANFFCSDCS